MRTATLVADDGIVEIRFPFSDEIVAAMRTVPGRRWDSDRKVWTAPKESIPDLYAAIDRFGFDYNSALMEILDAEGLQKRDEPPPDIDFDTVEPGYVFPVKPYIHQKFGISLALKHLDTFNFHAFLWEMGTGKTLAALHTVNIMMRRNRVHRTLIVCPSSLLENWAREIETHTPHLKYSILWGNRNQRIRALNKPAHIYLINYDYVARFEEALKKGNFHMIICDESTRIKTWDSDVSVALYHLGRLIRFRMAMTGTPITQSPQDAFSQFRYLSDKVFGTSIYSFRDTFCIMGGYGGYQVTGHKNLKWLREKISRHSSRFLKRDCLDLPDKVFEFIGVDMEDEQKENYTKMARQILQELQDEFGQDHRITASIVLTRMLRLSQICGGHLRAIDGTVFEFGSAKDKALKDMLPDLTQTGKVIIWCRFIPEIHKITEMCKDHNPAVIYGEVPLEKRYEIVQKFQTDPTCKVFIGQIATAGIGLNLTAASTAIYYSYDFSLEHYLQSQDRNHRIGVTGDKVTYINFYCKKSIDEAVMKALSKKHEIADDITGDSAYSKVERIIYGG